MDSTQADKVYLHLLDSIVTGRIEPGSRLREIDLSRDLGIGRGPLREAIQRLESRKLVSKIPHVGAQVVAFDLREFVEIYQIRENLESLACELAAQHMTEADFTQLKSLLERHEEHLQQNAGNNYIDQDVDLDFHFQIIQCSRNAWLIRLLCDELYHRVRMYRVQTSQFRERPEQALSEHQQIFYALRKRDGELAALLMRRHISAARRSLEEKLRTKITGVVL